MLKFAFAVIFELEKVVYVLHDLVGLYRKVSTLATLSSQTFALAGD